MLTEKSYDTGILLVVIQRFERQRLPRMSDIKNNLELGICLNEFDIEFLSEALNDARYLLPYLDKHPEYQHLLACIIHFYKVIADDALAAEKQLQHIA